MATDAQMRTDLAARANAITGLEVYDKVPDTIEVPAFVVGPIESIEYNLTAGPTGAIWIYLCRLYAARADAHEAQLTLGLYYAPTGTQSIKVALETEAT